MDLSKRKSGIFYQPVEKNFAQWGYGVTWIMANGQTQVF